MASLVIGPTPGTLINQRQTTWCSLAPRAGCRAPRPDRRGSSAWRAGFSPGSRAQTWRPTRRRRL